MEFYYCEFVKDLSPHCKGPVKALSNTRMVLEEYLGYTYIFVRVDQNLWQRYDPRRFQQAFFFCALPRVRSSLFLCNRFHIMCMSSYSHELTSCCNLRSPATQKDHLSVFVIYETHNMP